jgi:hypothetical protein
MLRCMVSLLVFFALAGAAEIHARANADRDQSKLKPVGRMFGCSIGSIDAHRGSAFARVADVPSGKALIYFYKALGYGRARFPRGSLADSR